MSIEAAIAGRLAGVVAGPLVGRLQRELARRGRARGSLALALDRIAAPDGRPVSPTALLNDLPHGVNNRDVLGCIETPEFRALAQQLMAVEILDGDLRAATKIKFALRDFFRGGSRTRMSPPSTTTRNSCSCICTAGARGWSASFVPR